MYILITSSIIMLITVTGCSGNGGGAGHWFHILFIIIPLGIFLYVINNKLDNIEKSISIEKDKISTLISQINKDQESKK